MTEPIVPASKLDLSAANDLATQLRQRDKGDIVVDMSQVTHLGALCMQTLISASGSLATKSRKLTLENVSERVEEQMRVMGMTPELLTKGPQ